MSSIRLKNVSVSIPVFDGNERSLRTEFVKKATGGIVLKEQTITYVRALDNVSFELNDGDRLGLFGHNGSGKTSLLRVLLGTYHPTLGEREINGQIQSLISIGAGLELSLSGRENITRMLLLNNPQKMVSKEHIESIIEFSDLAEFIDMPARIYSSGMLLRLSFALFINQKPDIILLDEFISAGDEKFSDKAEGLMDLYINRCKILVLTSHSRETLRKYCNRIAMMDKGKFTEVDVAAF